MAMGQTDEQEHPEEPEETAGLEAPGEAGAPEGFEEDEAQEEALRLGAPEEAEAPFAYEPDAEPEAFRPLRFVDVAVPLPSTNPVVVLQEVDPPGRLLRIPIGLPEGVAIAYAARELVTPRPLTHELMTNVLEAFGLVLEVVRITEVHGAAYVGEVVVSGPGTTRTFSCRPSDGIALALRQRLFVPVVAAVRVLDVAGAPPAGETGEEEEEEGAIDVATRRDDPEASGI